MLSEQKIETVADLKKAIKDLPDSMQVWSYVYQEPAYERISLEIEHVLVDGISQDALIIE